MMGFMKVYICTLQLNFEPFAAYKWWCKIFEAKSRITPTIAFNSYEG